MSNERPIGIFDSGIGGLTVASAIKSILPNEHLVYFGDIAHLPYGEKSAEAIIEYSKKIADFLISQNCKMIVIACNSSSSVAFDAVKTHIRNVVPVFNVIDPVVDYIADGFSKRKVGVIGTKRTMKSDVYAKKIKEKNREVIVSSLETPLLASMIEEGFIDDEVSHAVVSNYLSKKNLLGIDTLILGCTHYPLIKKEISHFYKNKVEIIDSALIVAEHIKKELSERNLSNANPSKSQDAFFVSDYTESFEKIAGYFFKNKIHLELVDIWG